MSCVRPPRSNAGPRSCEPLLELEEDPWENRTQSCTITVSEVEEHSLRIHFPSEHGKTLLAFLFMLIGVFASSLALASVHDKEPVSVPLPDIVFRYVPQLDRGLEISEYLLMLVTYPTFFMVFMHRYRWIILRRSFFMMGVLYFGRGITMFVTVLPQADLKYPCAARVNNTNLVLLLNRAASLLSGLGMSINGKLIYCGDFIYSGHTCSFVMCCLVFAEYTPQTRAIFRVAKLAMFTVATVGIILVSVSRTHYTIDILVAYFVTSMIFRVYHTIAASPNLKVPSSHNYFSQMWLFRLISYFEENLPEGKLPIIFDDPATIVHLLASERLKKLKGAAATVVASWSKKEASGGQGIL